MNIKKLCGYPHNEYPTDMSTSTEQISYPTRLVDIPNSDQFRY